MKLLLASSGFTNEEIIRACEELAEKPRAEINFIVINEAIKVEKGDHRWFVEGIQEIAENFGGAIELIDLQAHDLDYVCERIETVDVIFCFGGNTDYLTKVFQETGFAEKLPEILAKKVWVGSSAGSCVLCHKESKETTVEVFEETPMVDNWLNIVPIIFLPHFHSEWFRMLNKETALRETENTDLPAYLMSDQSAMKITGELDDLKYEVVGSDYFIARHGEVVERG